MSYPKPLSEKTLAKMYREANIDEKKSEFLHRLFLAASNLYGVIILRDLWDILKEIAPQYDMAEIKRKDLIAFSSIARREDVPYYVFEIDELYTEEKRSDLEREIVNKSIIGLGRAQFVDYYRLVEAQADKPYYVPNNILAYENPRVTDEETRLLKFLESLKVTATESEGKYGKKYTCTHTGESLSDFSFMNNDEEWTYKWYSGEFKEHPSRNEKILNDLLDRTSCSEAQKILRFYKEDCNIGSNGASENVRFVFDELNEVGVQLSKGQVEEMLQLLMQFNNNSHLWCNRGWSPAELARSSQSRGPVVVSIGPGIKRAIAEGKMTREEIEEQFRRYGITLVEQ